MTFPAFFEDAPVLRLRDPLAAFLGAAEDGVITYGYADVVRLAGHSCPTVAGAYLMVRKGLLALYGDDLPERGGVTVALRNARDQGTTGVVASVATLLTGAAAETGFQGIGAARLFARNDLLAFAADIEGSLALRRRDTGQGVAVSLNADRVPHDPAMSQLMPRAVAGTATPDERAEFARLWQERVRRMLVEHADDPELVTLADWRADEAPVRLWPAGLSPYKRTPEFTETTVPAGLLRCHSTKAGVWAKLHVLSGRLLFRDLVLHTEHALDPGIHALIHPQSDHEVAPVGEVRFFVEFHAKG